jgi:hypothetical protein
MKQLISSKYNSSMSQNLPTEANLMKQVMFNNPILLTLLQLIKPQDSQYLIS